MSPSLQPSRSFILAILLVAAAACVREPEPLVLSGPTMGTTYTVRVARRPHEISSQQLRVVIDEELQRVDAAMSGYRADSEISRFNASRSTDWFAVSAPLAEVMRVALEISEQSQGAFDVTVAPLVRLWGFGPGGEAPAELPDSQAIVAAREHTGYAKLHVRSEPAALRKDIATLAVDLNGIAPGFAVDLIARRFDDLGVADYMIDIGGEVRVRGRNAARDAWRIAVEKPIDSQPTPFAILKLADISVATSGEYRHYYARDGRKYSHTIDPRTGAPVLHTLASVVVLHPQAAYADAWATAFNVAGADAGYELATHLGMPVMFILAEGGELRTRMSSGFERYTLAIDPH